MAEVSALATGYQGIQKGLAAAQAAAEQIVRPDLGSGLEGLTEGAVNLIQAELQVAASAAVVDSAQETIGTLIDVFA